MSLGLRLRLGTIVVLCLAAAASGCSRRMSGAGTCAATQLDQTPIASGTAPLDGRGLHDYAACRREVEPVIRATLCGKGVANPEYLYRIGTSAPLKEMMICGAAGATGATGESAQAPPMVTAASTPIPPRAGGGGHIGVGSLPDGWPATVPVYPGAQISSSAGTFSGKVVTLETTDGPEQVASFYKGALPGWTKKSDTALGATHMMKYSDGAETLSIIASRASGAASTHVTLSIGR